MTWLEALRRASLDWRAPLPPSEWETVKERVSELPPDLRTLYDNANGVRLPAGLRLYPLSGGPGEISTLLRSEAGSGLWRFGRVGERGHLFAIQRTNLRGRQITGSLPEWVAQSPGDAWIYGIRNDASSETKLFPSLLALLARLIPSWLEPKGAAEEPEFAHSSDVQLVASDSSLEIDIDVQEPAPDPSMAITQKVKVPARKHKAKSKRPRGKK